MKKRFMKCIGIFVLSFFLLQTSWANDHLGKQSIFDVMNYQDVLNITLEGDFETIKNDRRSEEAYKAKLTFKDKEKNKQHWKIKLTLRGHYRRMNCAMPPLKLDFKKSKLEEAGLATFDDLKLVTHCSSSKAEAEDWLKREYMAYELYRQLSPNSYRVQLVRITYKDANTGKKDKNWGFLIEDTQQLAHRMKAEKIDQWGLTAAEFHTLDLKVLSVFQYMIGNTDWNIETSKNLKMFKKDGKVIPVPYDFDFSGLVATSYALPDANYGLKSIRERTYLGFKMYLNDLHDTRAIFSVQQRALINLIARSSILKLESQEDMLIYLEEFFDNIDDIQFREMAPTKVMMTAPSK